MPLLHDAKISIGDCRKKTTSRSLRVSETDAEAWLNAADDAAREATAVGLLLDAFGDMSDGLEQTISVEAALDFPPAFPAKDTDIYNFDQLTVTARNAAQQPTTITIPARSAAAYTVESDGVTVILGASGTAQVQNLVTRLEATWKDNDGEALVVEKIVVSR